MGRIKPKSRKEAVFKFKADVRFIPPNKGFTSNPRATEGHI